MIPFVLLAVGLAGPALPMDELSVMESLIPRAEFLLADSGCIDCHPVPALIRTRLEPRRAPRLAGLGARATGNWLERFLATPALHGPAPDLTSSLDGAELKALVHFLRSEPGDVVARSVHSAARLESGRRLFHTIGCVACHEPYEEAWESDLPYWFTPEEARTSAGDGHSELVATDERYVTPGTFAAVTVRLDDLDERHTVDSLTGYLLDPESIDPDGRMPSFDLTPREARDLSVYLLRDQALGRERVFQGVPGLAFERFDEVSGSELPDFDVLEAADNGVVADLIGLPEHPEDHFGLRFTGVIRIPVAGDWTFELTSDDGSRLEIDGECVIDNDGQHGPTTVSYTHALDAGAHAIRVEFWEESGGELLELTWQGPGVAQASPPAEAFEHSALVYRGTDGAAVEPALVARGAAIYERLACAVCHADEGARAPRLSDLSPGHAACIGDSPAEGLPRYSFSAADRRALTALLADPDGMSEPLADAERVQRSLIRSRCYACHRRDGIGGPHPERADHFRPSGDFDLGEEGRIPPHLTGVGSKLLPDTLRAVLLEGDRVRPYVATRMPRFGMERVEPLVSLFADVDGTLAWDAPPATPELRRAGRQLVGTQDGLGCIQCHRYMDVPSLGIQAVDLMHVKDRLQPGWFAQLLLDPQAVQLNTRMPSFWEHGRSPVDILERDPMRQTAAILAYFDQGDTAPLPPGLVTPDSAYELDTDGGTRSVSVFMQGLSPRTMLVGSPEGVHIAFDMQHSRLARIWTGRFFNAKGTWEGRAGVLELPPGDDFIELPGGTPVAILTSALSAWPEDDPQRLGQSYDGQARPTFRYRVGPITVADSSMPADDGASLLRHLELRADEALPGVRVRLLDDGPQDSYSVRVIGPTGRNAGAAPIVARTIDGRIERLVLPQWKPAERGFVANLKLEYRW
ncbi:MAG: cytochrome c551/c552 [Chlamydiales bacterium]